MYMYNYSSLGQMYLLAHNMKWNWPMPMNTMCIFMDWFGIKRWKQFRMQHTIARSVKASRLPPMIILNTAILLFTWCFTDVTVLWLPIAFCQSSSNMSHHAQSDREHVFCWHMHSDFEYCKLFLNCILYTVTWRSRLWTVWTLFHSKKREVKTLSSPVADVRTC